MQATDFSGFMSLFENAEPWIMRVNEFVYRVLCRYSDIVRPVVNDTEFSIENRTILPIGFFPSNILSNWVLFIIGENCFVWRNSRFVGTI